MGEDRYLRMFSLEGEEIQRLRGRIKYLEETMRISIGLYPDSPFEAKEILVAALRKEYEEGDEE